MHPQSNTSHLSQAPSGEKQRKAFNGEDPINPEDSLNPKDPINPEDSLNPKDPLNWVDSLNPEDSLNLKDSTVGITKIMRIIKVTEHQLAKEWSDIIINWPVIISSSTWFYKVFVIYVFTRLEAQNCV